MSERQERCDKCKFWEIGTGRCHRLSPRPSTPREAINQTMGEWDQDLSVWPITSESDWCGEFQAKTQNP